MIKEKIEEKMVEKDDDLKVFKKSIDGKGIIRTGKKKTKAFLQAQVEQLTKENAELKRELLKLQQALLTAPDKSQGQQMLEREKVRTDTAARQAGSTVQKTDDSGDDSGPDEDWTEVRGRRRRNIPRVQNGLVQTSNRFSVLDSGAEKEDVKCLVIGDSRVRPIGRVFCGDKDRCVVKPGATVAELGPIIQEELAKCDPEVVIVQVGVNDVGPRRSTQLVSDYTALQLRLKEARTPVIITGILPRLTASGEWHSRAISANASVEQLCANMGFQFVDLWEDFYGRGKYYLRDGMHLSDEGARVLGDAYLNVV